MNAPRGVLITGIHHFGAFMPRARRALIAVCAAMTMSAFLSTAGTSLVAQAGAGETAVTRDAVIPADVGLRR
jgi:hypothetical protein